MPAVCETVTQIMVLARGRHGRFRAVGGPSSAERRVIRTLHGGSAVRRAPPADRLPGAGERRAANRATLSFP
jgi:hypothetical protein